jgi:hypothetical protein
MSKHAVVVTTLLSLAAVASGQDLLQEREVALQAARHAYELAENSRTAKDSEVAKATYAY